MINFEETFSYKLIYVFGINYSDHKGLLKIGETTIKTEKPIESLVPNCKELNEAAKKRINSYMQTSSVSYGLVHTELAVRYETVNGEKVLKCFSDKNVHSVLLRSGIKRHDFKDEKKGKEWFEVDLETVKNAIKATKENRNSISASEISEGRTPIIFRVDQEKAINETVSCFKTGNHMLWNAKMRFGKTLCALQVAKTMEFGKTIIITHRPVVNDSWFEDFEKIFYDTDYKFGSKNKGETIEQLVKYDNTKFVYFASLQDLRGSEAVGGKFDKNIYEFLIDWDFVIIDEAHEGTQTKLGQEVINLLNDRQKKPKLLELSGTPFNIVNKFSANEIFTWDYVMEQTAKAEWDKKHFGDSNPYANLPQLKIYTYNLDKQMPGYIDALDSAFNFKEFFRTWTGKLDKDFKPVPTGAKVGDFVHEKDVKRLLDLMCLTGESNYPYSNEKYRQYFRHSLWMVPGVKEARALSKLLREHPVFKSFNIANVAGDGDIDDLTEKTHTEAMKKVRNAIGDYPFESYSITLSCGRLTTGVTVPEWTAVFMLAGSFSTSATNYMQTIFRVQSPGNINGKMKDSCYVFDFAPDRTLKMVAEAGSFSVNRDSRYQKHMGEFLNFCPVISVNGSEMLPYNASELMQQLKKVFVDRAVRSGFEDDKIYNENLLKLDGIDLEELNNLKKIVGASKPSKKGTDVDVNSQGYTDEQYDEIEKIKKKPKKELTEEEKAKLEEDFKKKENKRKAISILRGISVRIPLLIYGAKVDFNKDITIENFTEIIDDDSWREFMPRAQEKTESGENAVTKAIFKRFSKYYDADIFVAAGRKIRQLAKAADELLPTERVKAIAGLFATFKNPDKETVLTPWRVVNMHMSDCLGGYDFFDEEHKELLEEPRFVDRGEVTKQTFANTKSQILEINSKTGLYPLYVVYSIYRKRCEEYGKELTREKHLEFWNKTVQENLFVICKTEMAKYITQRTVCGYSDTKINAHYFEDLINQLKEKPEQFKAKVTRGSYWNKGEKEMKFDAIVGNPPYQEDNSNNARKLPVYHLFYEAAFRISKLVSLITPARFLFKAGQTPNEWNEKMLNDEHVKVISFFSDSKEVFPTVDIKGGVAIILRNEVINFGKIGTFTIEREVDSILKKVKNDKFISFSDIVYSKSSCGLTDRLYVENPCLKTRLTKGNEYIIDAGIFDKIPEIFYDVCPSNEGYIKVFGRQNNNRIYKFVKEEYIKNSPNLNKYKVIIPGVNGTGRMGECLSELELGKPKVAYTQTFMSFGAFNSEEEAIKCLKYIKTRFLRLLLGTLKVTQNNAKETWSNIPLQDFTEKSDIDWSKSISEIDKQLYAKYYLDESEITFIESMIKPME